MALFLTGFRTEGSKHFGPVECGEAHERAIRYLYREGVIAQCGNHESPSTGPARKDLEQQLVWTKGDSDQGQANSALRPKDREL